MRRGKEIRIISAIAGRLTPAALGLLLSFASPSAPQSVPSHFTGNQACAGCHPEIARNYALTAMAAASGPATQEPFTGEFQHAPSGVHYRVYTEQGRVWMSFGRTGAGANDLQGTRELDYFIGSGHRGRTYLFSVDGFFFEAPINWYGQQKRWDMAPAYQQATAVPMNLPAASSCLACHTSNPQTPAPGTENQYAMPLFAHPGITCERCHGAGSAHVENPRKADLIVNPAKLSPELREAVCMQCHFEGRVAVQQPGRVLGDFQPGERLSDYVHYYVLSGNGETGLGALSQTEALAESVCKRRSGEKMGCTSCHDPHYSPGKEEKAAYYRAKCIACHGEKFAAKHQSKQPDCRSCHMPPVDTSDIAHTQATDHRILRNRKNAIAGTTVQGPLRLVRFPPDSGEPSSSDLALGWTTLAQGGMKAAEPEAHRWLPQALQENPSDAAVLAALGFDEQKHGLTEKAREHYLAALAIDPLLNEAALDLGVIEAQSGNVERALALWRGPFERIPGRSEVGMNLARLYCAAGQLEKARDTVGRVLKFNPDLASAREFERALSRTPRVCSARPHAP